MAIVDELARAAVVESSTSPLYPFLIEHAQIRGDHLECDIVDTGGATARLRVSLPSTERDQYWVYAAPRDEHDWADQLLTWIHEEVATGGLGASRARVEDDGHSYVVVTPYGWRLDDEMEHRRLEATVPPNGWYGI
jgi:hypothetical protein